jgi:ferritin-like protein
VPREYHESGLSESTKDLHRAITTLIEEWEAVDWYQQRLDVTGEEELKAILEHHRDEEIEHAVMALEWLRRKLPFLDQQLRQYLYKEGPIRDSHNGKDSVAHSTGDLGLASMK